MVSPGQSAKLNDDMSSESHLRHWRDLGAQFLRGVIEMPLRSMLGRQHPSRHQPGAGPGTLFIASDASATRIRLIRIEADGVELVDQPEAADIARARAMGGRLWVDIAGLADDDRLRELGNMFGLDPPTLADLVNIGRQTRLETFEGSSLIVTQFLQLDPDHRSPELVQLGLVQNREVLLSFRERPGPVFDPILERLQRPTSRLRSEALDYLLQALLDVAVDGAFPVVEALADRIDDIEDRILAGQGQNLMIEIHGQRRALITLGRLLWRQRDLLGRMLREEQMFRRETQVHLREIHDRSMQLLDLVETTRELASSLVEMQLSISANRSNQIMKTLTIMASIFIPLTFIAGIYGMNFERMPELSWPLGYPLVLLLMLAVALGLLWWFRRRGWLGADD